MALRSYRKHHMGLRGVITRNDPGSVDLAMQALSLSPIDPLQYAFLSVRALGHTAGGDMDQAVEWAEKAVIAPRAHHLIVAVCAAINGLAGRDARHQEVLALLHKRAPDFDKTQLIRALPFRDIKLREAFVAQLG
ncbi:MAG: hypothetical protein AAF525_18855 [Pseudomonadota bacterium]